MLVKKKSWKNLIKPGIITIMEIIAIIFLFGCKNSKYDEYDESSPYIVTSNNFICLPIGGAVKVNAAVFNLDDDNVSDEKWSWKADRNHIVKIDDAISAEVIIRAENKGATYITIRHSKCRLIHKIFVSCMTEKEYEKLRSDFKCNLIQEEK